MRIAAVFAALLAATAAAAADLPAREKQPDPPPKTPAQLQQDLAQSVEKFPNDPAKVDAFVIRTVQGLDGLAKAAPKSGHGVEEIKKKLAQLHGRLERAKRDKGPYDPCLEKPASSPERAACVGQDLRGAVAGLRLDGSEAPSRRVEVAAPQGAVPALDTLAFTGSRLGPAGPGARFDGGPAAGSRDPWKLPQGKFSAPRPEFTDDAARAELARALRAEGKRKFYQGDIGDRELRSSVAMYQSAHGLPATGNLADVREALGAQAEEARKRSEQAPQRGDEGERVGALQKLLRKVDPRLAVDNKFGDRTHRALCRFLAAQGLGQHCEVSPEFARRLGPAAEPQPAKAETKKRIVSDVPSPDLGPVQRLPNKRLPREKSEGLIPDLVKGIVKGAAELSGAIPRQLPPSSVPLTATGQAVRQLQQYFPMVPHAAFDSLAQRLSRGRDTPRYVAVADLHGPAGAKRLGVIDLSRAQSDPRGAVQWYAVKEGRGGRKGNPLRTSPLAARYENVNGSFLTPSGLFALPRKVESKYGGALRLHGLDGDNVNSADRGILMHRAFRHAWSEGCLEIEGNVRAVLAKLRGGLVYIAH